MSRASTEPDTGLLLRAARFAAEHHRSQRRKGLPQDDEQKTIPYINHPIQVAELLSSLGGVTDPAVLCAALLHDTVEDTDVDDDMLRDAFGARIADIVAEVTDDKSLPKEQRKQLQIDKTPSKSTDAKLLKLADKIMNLRDLLSTPPDWPLSRILAYFEWARLVVAGLRGTNAVLEAEFDRLYALRPSAR